MENEIDVSYVQSFAFREGSSHSAILFNLSLTQTLPVQLGLPFYPGSQLVHYELAASSIHDDNEDEETITIETWQGTAANPYSLALPPHSITVLHWPPPFAAYLPIILRES